MKAFPVPANESSRLEALSALDIIGSAPEPEFDAVVSLACETFHVPIALVSFLDGHQQWFKARQGMAAGCTEREHAFCNYVVVSGGLIVVEDALSDPRFNQNALVTGEPKIRFYAGAPLSIDPGVHLGTLCIIDLKPRTLTAGEADQLRRMAEIVGALLRQHRDARAVVRLAQELEQRTRQIGEQATLLVRQKGLFDRASALTKLGAWEWDLRSDEFTWTDVMYDMHDLPRGSKISRDIINTFYLPEVREDLDRLHEQSVAENTGYTFEGEMKTAKGKKRWVRLTAHVDCENGKVVRRYGVKQDITEQKAVWDQMIFLAECDPLTRLPNRATFQRQLERLRNGPDATTAIALMLIDIDGFKHVNDTFGHSVGDECLKQIGRRLKRACPEAGLVARLGGDEFALLLDAREPGIVEACVKRVLSAARRPVRRRGQSFQLSASIGVTTSDSTLGPHSSDLFTEADLALYAAKDAGRNTSRSYTAAMKVKANERFEVVRNITRALDRKQLELFYQPKIHLGRGDALAGFEALLRWRRPDGQVVAAGAFAAALEDPELSDRIGEWVIQEALHQARAWHEAGLGFGHIAINLSSGQFREPDFAHRLIGRIADHGLDPAMIEVEVTEGVFLNHEASNVKNILNALRRAGIRIALDDFGTGYASLSHLRTYPVDILKIDRSFVQHFLTSFQDHAILQSTLFLARHLRLDVVAEGIEEAEQCEFLRALGCGYGQGYLFSKAVCAAEAAEWCLPVAARVRNVA